LDYWVNAYKLRGVLKRQRYDPGDAVDGRIQPAGCAVLQSGYSAYCTLAEEKWDGGDSTFPVQRYVVRTWIIAEVYNDGRVLYRQQLADYPNDKWYYVCFGNSLYNPPVSRSALLPVGSNAPFF
jgi:hypothetical protein